MKIGGGRQIGPPALSQRDAGQSRLLECLLRQSLSIARVGGRAGARSIHGSPFSQRKQSRSSPPSSLPFRHPSRIFFSGRSETNTRIRAALLARAPPGRDSTCLKSRRRGCIDPVTDRELTREIPARTGEFIDLVAT